MVNDHRFWRQSVLESRLMRINLHFVQKDDCSLLCELEQVLGLIKHFSRLMLAIENTSMLALP
jgi:hypothetical protein